jgi:hypothetical protein
MTSEPPPTAGNAPAPPADGEVPAIAGLSFDDAFAQLPR